MTLHRKVTSPDMADEICRIAGIKKRERAGSTTFSKGELQRILIYLKMPVHLPVSFDSTTNQRLPEEQQ